MKKISIVVPVYNVEPYLKQCVDSILAQTYENLEIILVNNDSTDGSGLICDAYEKKDTRVKVIHQENRFPVGARNSGILASTGDYVGYVDSDDWIEPNMYEVMIQILENDSEIDFVSVGYWEEEKNVSKLAQNGKVGRHLSSEADYIEKLFLDGEKKVSQTIWNKLFRCDVAKKYHVLPENIRRIEDVCCIVVTIPFVLGYQVLDLPLYHYRKHENSIISEQPLPSEAALSSVCQYLKEIFEKHPQKEILTKQLQEFYLNWIRRWMYWSGPFEKKETVDTANLLPYHHFTGLFEALATPEKVIVYGYGYVGKSYVEQLSRKMELVAVVDKNKQVDQIDGIPVIHPKEVMNFSFDSLILAIYHEKSAIAIKNDLVSTYAVPENKIRWNKPDNWKDLFLKEVQRAEDEI